MKEEPVRHTDNFDIGDSRRDYNIHSNLDNNSRVRNNNGRSNTDRAEAGNDNRTRDSYGPGHMRKECPISGKAEPQPKAF